jgi:dihydrofolate reductase
MIAAVDECYGLGKNNQLLCYLPADLKYFKENTVGKTVIMGRKTFASIGKALPNRQNIVLSKEQKQIDEVEVASTLGEALQRANPTNEIMIIGGASIYEQALNLATTIYLTVIHHQFEADVFFPRLDFTQWDCQSKQFRPKDEKNSYDLTFYQYIRKANMFS